MPESADFKTFTKKTLIAVGIALLSILIILLAYFAIDVIFSVFAAVLLAVFLRSLGNLLTRYAKVPQGVSVLLVVVVLLGVLGIGIWLLAPEVADQIRVFRESFPRALANLSERIGQYNFGQLILEQIPEREEIFNEFTSGEFISRIGGLFSTTFGLAANLIVILLVGIYLATEPEIYTSGLIKLFPISRRRRVRDIISEIGETLKWWLVGKILAMLIIGVLTTIGLYLLGVQLALTLGIFAALIAFIPNFGPIIGAAPAVLIALVDNPIKAAYVIALFVGIQLFESYLITPMIERETVSLPPVLTIFFQIFLGVLAGGLGLILATPLLATIIVLIKMLYIEDVLGDDVELPSERPRESNGENQSAT